MRERTLTEYRAAMAEDESASFYTTDADHPECAFYGHSPNAAGTECELCGFPAEIGDPDELAAALSAELDARLGIVPGQTSWLEK